VEVFARDIAQWGTVTRETVGENWSEVRASLEYHWTDAEAEAAGWNRAPNAFSWRETMQHAGKVTVSVDQPSMADTFDLEKIQLFPR
jgi:hypothetical protein